MISNWKKHRSVPLTAFLGEVLGDKELETSVCPFDPLEKRA